MKAARIILVLGCLILTGCSEKQDETKMYLGNAQNSGVEIFSQISETPELNWKFNSGGAIISSPVIGGEMLFFGNENNIFFALDKNSGKEIWAYKADGRISSSPAVDNEQVYFNSFDGNFYALKVTDGSLSWKFRTGGETRFGAYNLWGNTPLDIFKEDPWDFYISSPAIDDGLIYFGSGDSTIYALNAETGEKIWDFKTGHVVHSSPAIFGNALFCGSFDGFLYSLDKKSGSLQWKLDTGQDEKLNVSVGIQSSPVIHESTIYVGTRSAKLQAIDALNGEVKWEYKHHEGSWIVASPSISEGVVSFGTSDGFSFVGLDINSGEVIYDTRIGAWIFSTAAISGLRAYFGSFNGRIFAVDQKTGVVVWQFATDGFKNNSGVYDESGGVDRVLFGKPEDMNNTYAFMLEAVEKRLASGAILSSPLIENSVIYFGSMDGYLYSLK